MVIKSLNLAKNRMHWSMISPTTVRRRHFFVIVLGCIVVLVIIALIISLNEREQSKQTSSFQENEYLSQKLPIEKNVYMEVDKSSLNLECHENEIKKVAKLIYNAKRHVRGYKTSAYLDMAMHEIEKLLKRMDVSPSSVYKRVTETPKSVCPEIFKGGSAGFPLYHTGFEQVNCNYSVAMSKLITIINYVDSSNISIEDVKRFLSSVAHTLPGVKVLLSTNSRSLAVHLQQQNFDYSFTYINNSSEGYHLNKMISKVKTPYIMLARGNDFLSNDSRLFRLIGEIESLNVVAAGGAFRYPNGNWAKGCFQVLYRNFTLKYFEGYDESLHECIFCDYIQGPFVVTTEYLIKHRFQDLDAKNGLYEDFFLRIFQKGDECVVCPDSMFHIHPTSKPPHNWDKFMLKWRLDELFTVEGIHVNLSQRSQLFYGEKQQILSPSNLRTTSEAVKIIMASCQNVGVLCELQEGTELGAVKMNKVLPWDIDFDIRFVSNNCSQCSDLAREFKTKGLNFKDFVTPCCTTKLKLGQINYVGIQHMFFWGDISGHPLLDSTFVVERGLTPTKIFFDGAWLQVPGNPGLVMRNRYGREIYQHAEHYKVTNTDGFKRMNYTTNVFLSCYIPRSHDCLKSYNADGNMQFLYFLP